MQHGKISYFDCTSFSKKRRKISSFLSPNWFLVSYMCCTRFSTINLMSTWWDDEICLFEVNDNLKNYHLSWCDRNLRALHFWITKNECTEIGLKIPFSSTCYRIKSHRTQWEKRGWYCLHLPLWQIIHKENCQWCVERVMVSPVPSLANWIRVTHTDTMRESFIVDNIVFGFVMCLIHGIIHKHVWDFNNVYSPEILLPPHNRKTSIGLIYSVA